MENIHKFKNWKLYNHLCEIRVDGIEPQIDIFWRFLLVNQKFPIWVKLSTICLVIFTPTYSQSRTLFTLWDDDMNTGEESNWQLFDNYFIIL